MKTENRCALTIVIGIITSLVTVLSLAIIVFVFFDRKRKKEEIELEEYLESTIS